jgi:hypothetical protein
LAGLDYPLRNRNWGDCQTMTEPKAADTERMDALTSAAVMPCVGGFIFYVGQNRTEIRPDFENQNAGAMAVEEDAGVADRKRTP